MARVLAISSQVVRGHIGLCAVAPALQRLGHEVWPLPTIILSNHPGHPHAAGQRIEAGTLDQFIAALDHNGWLGEIDAVLTGYLPSADHAAVAAELIRRLKSERPVVYLCDPVLGDEPKGLYIDANAAQAIRDSLILLADVITPNRFELGWLTGRPLSSAASLAEAARGLSGGTVVVTSAARRGDTLDTMLVDRAGVFRPSVAWRSDVPHGTGDVFAGLFLGHVLNGLPETEALARSVAGVEVAIEASAGHNELVLTSQNTWATAAPLAVEAI